ncbi:MAG TPA: EAL domain-containing protein [Vitreimonas sp.]|nr:EAL domain-containing protein [Vitreimonas sp.]
MHKAGASGEVFGRTRSGADLSGLQRVPRLARVVVGVGLLAVAYFVAARFGQLFATTDAGVTSVWPASGIALAAVVRYGIQLGPGVFIGATLASAALSTSWLAGGMEGVAATIQSIGAAYALRRLGFRLDLRRMRDVALLLFATFTGAIVAAGIGVGGLVMGGVAAAAEYSTLAFVWFVGDFLGALVIGSLLLTLDRGRATSRSRLPEAVVLTGVTLVVTAIVFSDLVPAVSERPAAYVVGPLVAWAALRFGTRGAAGSVALMSLFILGYTARGVGPFVHATAGENLVVAQLFIAVLSGTGLSLAAVIAERKRATAGVLREAAALRKQEVFLAGVLENLEDGIAACDADGRLTLFNGAARRVLGLPNAAVPPAEWGEHYRVYRPDGITPLPPEEVPLYRALKGEHVRDAELVIRRSDAPPRRLMVSGQPLRSADGEALGAVVAMHDVTDQKSLEARLRHQALHDQLTGLGNRSFFANGVRRALARRGGIEDGVAVLLLDLDDFKSVNDSLGHETGDEVLVSVARLLEASVRPGDMVARFGADEFSVLLEEIGDVSTAVRSAERILRAMRTPLSAAGIEVPVSASIGVAFESGADSDVETLLRSADLAMYRAKEHGKGCCEVFDQQMHRAVLERLQLKADLQGGIARREFRVHYQPVVNLGTGEIVGAEALVRWPHPERGVLAPEAFITVAEETGLIVPIGRWVLREACRQLARWQRNLEGAPVTVSVNLSARQLQDPNLETDIAAALNDAGVPGTCLTLEVTESLLIAEGNDAIETLTRLTRLGIKIAVDDFGTGYSSLSYLARLPVGILKIDRSFVETLNDGTHGLAVARMVIDLGRTLGLAVVAEGVERPDQAAVLRGLSCDFAQGYLFGRPTNARAFGKLTRRGTATSRGPDDGATDPAPKPLGSLTFGHPGERS